MDTIQTISYVLLFIAFFWLFFKSVNYFEKDLITMSALFIVAIAVFVYMVYVLLKPEKF